MIKMLYLHILQADSTENWNAFCKLIVLDNHTISKKSKTSVLRYIENITGSVGNFVKCIWPFFKTKTYTRFGCKNATSACYSQKVVSGQK